MDESLIGSENNFLVNNMVEKKDIWKMDEVNLKKRHFIVGGKHDSAMIRAKDK